MILVLLAGLAMGAVLQISRADPIDADDLKLRVIMLSPFLIMIATKSALIVMAQSRRWAAEAPTEPRPVDELGCDDPPY